MRISSSELHLGPRLGWQHTPLILDHHISFGSSISALLLVLLMFYGVSNEAQFPFPDSPP